MVFSLLKGVRWTHLLSAPSCVYHSVSQSRMPLRRSRSAAFALLTAALLGFAVQSQSGHAQASHPPVINTTPTWSLGAPVIASSDANGVPGALNVGNPLNNFPPGSPNCPSPPNQFPCPSVNFANPEPQLSLPIAEPMSIAGQFVADGAGNITSGSGFVFSQSLHTTDGMTYTVFDRSCNFTLTGTYSITSGTSTMTINPVGTCITPGLSATFNLLPGNAERRDGVEFGVMYLSSPIANPGGFSSFFNGSFFKQ